MRGVEEGGEDRLGLGVVGGYGSGVLESGGGVGGFEVSVILCNRVSGEWEYIGWRGTQVQLGELMVSVIVWWSYVGCQGEGVFLSNLSIVDRGMGGLCDLYEGGLLLVGIEWDELEEWSCVGRCTIEGIDMDDDLLEYVRGVECVGRCAWIRRVDMGF
ncbi:hypothetical protein Tco_0705435 [Tanacetum coccineum]|uniref:Uncharacterized protein n=1 Tax=Tanacetum coccineum TaxID=301880 RepID=A0ABQ4Y4L1_9ASTR